MLQKKLLNINKIMQTIAAVCAIYVVFMILYSRKIILNKIN